MGEAIGQLLPFAVGVAFSPTAIVATVLMLITPQAKANGLTFLVGWMAGIALVGAGALALLGSAGAAAGGEPAGWVAWLKLGLGVLLLLVAGRQWRARPAPDEDVPMPKWMGALDHLTPLKAGGLAILIGAINPKNLLLLLGGAAAVAQVGLPPADQAVAWLVFTVVASLGVLLPVGIYFLMGDRAAATLAGLKDWMARNNTAVMAVLCLLIGVKLLGDALTALTA
jgi:hypothetical protein